VTGTATVNQKSIANVTPEFSIILDRFGYLDAQYSAAKHWLDERETLKKQIQTAFESHPADQPIHLAGELYLIDLTVRANCRTVFCKAKAFAALKKAIGIDTLIAGLTFTLKLIDEFIPAEKQKAFITADRSGPRDIRSIVKAAPKSA